MLLRKPFRDRLEPRDWRRIWRDPPGFFFPGCGCCESEPHPDCTNCSDTLACEYLLSVSGAGGSDCCDSMNGDHVLSEVVIFGDPSPNVCGNPPNFGSPLPPVGRSDCSWISPWLRSPFICGEDSTDSLCDDTTLGGSTSFNTYFLLTPRFFTQTNTWWIRLMQHRCHVPGGAFIANSCWITNEDCPFWVPQTSLPNTSNIARQLVWQRVGSHPCDLLGEYTFAFAFSVACGTTPPTITLSEI